MGPIRNLVEHHKSLMIFQRYVDQLVLFVSGLANRMKTNCLLFCENQNG